MIESHPSRQLNVVSSSSRGKYFAAVGVFLFASLLSTPIQAAPKRCDWHGPKSSGEATYNKCIDFAAIQGTTVNVPKNVTRISADGISFCSGVFTQAGAGNADIVFIYDNSGSMASKVAYVDAALNDTVFYYQNGTSTACNINVTGPMIYQTLIGTRTISKLASAGCNTISGDPYYARGQVIQKAIDFLVANSPTSTAGAVSFTDKTAHLRSPLQLSLASNATLVKNSIVLDSSGGTYYGPPLQQAKDWLTDPAIIKTQRQAIIFISDGAPTDTTGTNSYLNISGLPPVYSIYLGDAAVPDTLKLKQLSDKTGGTFTRVNPRNVTAIQDVMNSIVKSITATSVPKSVTVVNSSLTPPQTSHSSGPIVVNADGSQGVTLDSIIGLNTGANNIQINVIKPDNTPVNYSFTINVSSAEISATGGNYTCWDMPTLTAVDPAGLAPEIYAPGGTGYTLKLTRSTSELRNVTVAGISGNGDKENITLGTPTSPLGFATQTGDFKYNPIDATPTLGNGTLEVDKNGALTFTWSHPRDGRETVTYILPGRITPVINSDVVFTIKDPITQGEVITPVKLENPVVIVDGKNTCLSNCNGTQVFWPNANIPTWILSIKSPITYSVHVYDNIGQSVAMGRGEITLATWNTMAKSGDSAAIQLKLPPLASNGQLLGTGAYVMRVLITAQGDQITKNSAGELIIVKNSKREYFKKFGFIRK